MSSERLDSSERQEVVSEREDVVAEEAFLNEQDIKQERDRLVGNFEATFFSLVGGDVAFKESFGQALDDIIDTATRKMVNVRDINDLSPEERKDIKATIESRMKTFKAEVEKYGPFRTVETVEKAKGGLKDFFKFNEYSERVEAANETNNDATFDFHSENDSKGNLESVTIAYAEPAGNSADMSLVTNEKFFRSDDESTEGSLAFRIKENRDSYLLDGVNNQIKDPPAFRQFLIEELKSDGGLDPSNLMPEQAIKFAVEIVKRNLSVTESKTLDEMDSDKIPIDQLIMGGGTGCCRHFTTATVVVFEQIQALVKASKNDRLTDIVMFENHMPELQHSTVAIARGDKITTVDPLWYKRGIMKNPDSTFHKDHGNLTSLYTTLCKIPKGHPERRIFDEGSAVKMVDMLYRDKGLAQKTRELVNNEAQTVMMRARRLILNEKLHTPSEILVTAKTLEILANRLLTRDIKHPQNKMVLDGLKILGGALVGIIDLKLEKTGKGPDYDSLEYSKYKTQFFVVNSVGAKLREESTLITAEFFPKQYENEIGELSVSEDTKEQLKVDAANALLITARGTIGYAIAVGKTMDVAKQYYEKANFVEKIKPNALAAARSLVDFLNEYGLKEHEIIKREMDRIRGYMADNLPGTKGTLAYDLTESLKTQLSA